MLTMHSFVQNKVAAKVEFYISIRDRLILIMISRDISNIVVINENEEELER